MKIKGQPALFSLVLYCCCFILPPDGFALPNDRFQIMQLSANSAELIQEQHLGIYTGNVQMDQGSTHLRADQAMTKGNQENKLIEAIATGSQDEPAHYWTLTATDKPPLHAYANKICYYPEQHLIKLIGEAHIEQGNDSFSAPEIIYDTLHQHVLTKSRGQSRTTIIIHPEPPNRLEVNNGK